MLHHVKQMEDVDAQSLGNTEFHAEVSIFLFDNVAV